MKPVQNCTGFMFGTFREEEHIEVPYLLYMYVCKASVSPKSWDKLADALTE